MNIDRSGSSTQRYFVHADLLGSTKALTTASGTVAESLEYYPFGSIKDDVGSRKESKKYIGAEYDEETGLNYLNARYQNGQTGKFISQDPVFWEIGQSDDGDKVLMDPQSQNSYSYVRNNPIINKDPKGRYWETVFDVAMLSWSLSDFKENPSFWNGLGVVADGASLALPIPAVVGGLRHGDDAYKGFRIAQDVARTSNWGNPASLMQHTFDHAIDFGLKKTDYAGYAKATNDFLSNAEVSVKQGSKNFESFVDSNNRTFFFDGNTSTFGIKNADGTAVTAYKPKGGDPQKALDYWNKQKIRYNGKK
jgi:RHS repeat-associated protein